MPRDIAKVIIYNSRDEITKFVPSNGTSQKSLLHNVAQGPEKSSLENYWKTILSEVMQHGMTKRIAITSGQTMLQTMIVYAYARK